MKVIIAIPKLRKNDGNDGLERVNRTMQIAGHRLSTTVSSQSSYADNSATIESRVTLKISTGKANRESLGISTFATSSRHRTC